MNLTPTPQLPSLPRTWLVRFAGPAVLALIPPACGRVDLQEPSIITLSPSMVTEGRSTAIELRGANFLGVAEVDLGSRRDVAIDLGFRILLGSKLSDCRGVRRHSTESVSCVVPTDLALGTHAVVLVTPGGQRAISPVLLEVVRPGQIGTLGSGGMPATPGSGGAASFESGGTSSPGSGGTSSPGSGGVQNTSGAGGAVALGGQGGVGNVGGGSMGSGGTGGTGGASGLNLGECTQVLDGARPYLFCPLERLTWPAARDACGSVGMALPRPDTALKNQFIVDKGVNLGVQMPWIAANDSAQEGRWEWADGQQFWVGDDSGFAFGALYNNWESGEPNDNTPGTGQDCAMVDLSDGLWGDTECSPTLALGLVCEAP